MIAQALRLHETSVQRHISEYLNNGKLMPENGGSDSHLSETQTAELTEYLTNNLLPTTQAIIELVDEWWDIRYTVPGMTKWLHRNGFSYRKPVSRRVRVPDVAAAEAGVFLSDSLRGRLTTLAVAQNVTPDAMLSALVEREELRRWLAPVPTGEGTVPEQLIAGVVSRHFASLSERSETEAWHLVLSALDKPAAHGGVVRLRGR